MHYLLLLITLLAGCQRSPKQTMESATPGSFGYDLHFLKKRDPALIVLASEDSTAQVIVSPRYQGKVFTSTAEGASGRSFGWIDYNAFEGQPDQHMNAYGGENRLWLGPEGAQYALFFKPGAPMEFTQWHTPPAFDTEPWQLSRKQAKQPSCRKTWR